ncbi:MAG: hypothetical protein IPJ58_09100 [Ardenticatenia bacterium]|nr:hypothetical protein [Ardenticatenia bacterium]
MATFSLPSDLVPKPVDVNAVDTALRLGWAGFRRHPWLLAIPLLVMEMGAYMLAAALVGSEMVVSDSMDHWLESDFTGAGLAKIVLLPNAAFLIAGIATKVAFLPVALRAVRNEPVGLGSYFAWIGRLPGIVLALLLGGICVAIPPASAGLAIYGLHRASALVALHLPAGALGQGVAMTLVYLVMVAIGIAGGLGFIYVLTGLSQVPLLIVDRRQSALTAMLDSWELMDGRRLAYISLVYAYFAMQGLGVLALVIGLVVTAPAGLATLAAFYHGLPRSSFSGPAGRAPVWRGRGYSLAALTLDMLVVWLLACATVFPMMMGSTRAIIDILKRVWLPYGMGWIVVPLSPMVLIPILYLWRGAMRRRTVGTWIIGPGWGRMRWLAVIPFGFVLLTFGLPFGLVTHLMGRTLLTVGGGSELARRVVFALPTEYASSPSVGEHSERLRLPAAVADVTLRGPSSVEAGYRITDSHGVAYPFRLRRYHQVQTAREAMERLAASGARPEPRLGLDAVAIEDPTAEVVRMAQRWESTLIIGESAPQSADGLRRLMVMQGDALPEADAALSWIWRLTSDPDERLLDEEASP